MNIAGLTRVEDENRRQPAGAGLVRFKYYLRENAGEEQQHLFQWHSNKHGGLSFPKPEKVE